MKQVVEQLKAVAKGDIKPPDTAKRRLGNIVFAAVTLSPADVLGLVRKVTSSVCSSYMVVSNTIDVLDDALNLTASCILHN